MVQSKVIVPKPKAELQANRGELQKQSKEIAKALWSGKLTVNEQAAINQICLLYGLDPILKQVVCLGGNVYITGGGLKVIGNKKPETAIDGIEVAPATKEEREAYGCSNNTAVDENYQHLFKSIVYKKGCSHSFIEWGEADKSNVKLYNADFKAIADMAKTRAVNRALRNAYDIAFTSLEEMGYAQEQVVDVTGEVIEEKDSPYKDNRPNGYKQRLEKAEMAKKTIGEEKYYDILGSIGYEHANEIKDYKTFDNFLEMCRKAYNNKK